MAENALITAHFIIRAATPLNRRYVPLMSFPYPDRGLNLPRIFNVPQADIPARLNGLIIVCSVPVPAVVPPSVVYVVDAGASQALPPWVPVDIMLTVPARDIQKKTETGTYYTFSENCKQYIGLARDEFARLQMPVFYKWLKGSAEVLGGNRLLVGIGEGELVVSECPVCFVAGVDFLLPCGHVIHRSCMEKWMGFGNRTCPVCRQDVVA